MSDRIKDILLGAGVVVCLGLATLVGYGIGLKKAQKAVLTEFVMRVDTLTIRDTITRVKPEYRLIRKTDTMRVAVTDTVRITDTLYLQLPREQRTYEAKEYRAVVSGFRPSLDTIEVYGSTKYITKILTPKPKRWGIGVQAGCGASKDGLTPYIGVGLSYNLARW